MMSTRDNDLMIIHEKAPGIGIREGTGIRKIISPGLRLREDWRVGSSLEGRTLISATFHEGGRRLKGGFLRAGRYVPALKTGP